tara:strand:+ start:72 stop:758 length:687 start_codon:yes stop_codon:yes gene_type:complete
MAIEKILVGDDRIDYARRVFPSIPETEVDFVDTPEEFIKKAQTGEYSTIITDLMYTPTGQEGFDVLESVKNLDARKILWTGNAYDEGVRKRAEGLGAEVLGKDELGSLIGATISKVPLKQDGMALIYCPDEQGVLYKAMERVVGMIFDPDKVKLSSNLEEELTKNEYGLVVDTTTMRSQGEKVYGKVAHDIKYMKLKEAPKIVSLPNVSTALIDMVTHVSNFYESNKR